MTLQELLQKHSFESLINDLNTTVEKLPALRETYNDLLQIVPGVANGEKIIVSTELDIDENGNVINHRLHASIYEDDSWDECLAKEVIYGTKYTETRVLAQILWQMTFY